LILYQGLLSSPASWARVGRGYLGGMLRAGTDVAAVITRGFRYDPDFPLPPGLPMMSLPERRTVSPPEIGLGFLHPPHLERLIGDYKANLFVWESNRVPPSWAEKLKRETDVVLVPSRFTQQALIETGVPADQVAVVPYGYSELIEIVADRCSRDPSANPPDRPFTYLVVAAPHWRKGIRELCRAFADTFSKSDDVVLRIKTTYDPATAKRRFPFEIPSWDSLFKQCGLCESGSPRVELMVRTHTDAEMLELYAQADVYVGPSWGESFGLAILDAMAMGLPVIANGWGGQTEFIPSTDDLVDFELSDRQEGLYESADAALVAIPSVASIAGRLRWHFENQEASRQIGESCRKSATPRTWDVASVELLRVLDRRV